MLQAKLVHALPGRMRLSFPSLRGKPKAIERLQQRIASLETVEECKADPRTGSVVISYEGEQHLLITSLHEGVPQVSIEEQAPVASGKRLLTKPIRIVSGSEVSPMFVLGSALMLLGGVQVFRRRIAVPSITAFWYGLEAFRQARKAGGPQ